MKAIFAVLIVLSAGTSLYADKLFQDESPSVSLEYLDSKIKLLEKKVEKLESSNKALSEQIVQLQKALDIKVKDTKLLDSTKDEKKYTPIVPMKDVEPRSGRRS